MPPIISREVRLISRPHGKPTAENFAIDRTVLADLKGKEVLVRNLFLSVDPTCAGG